MGKQRKKSRYRQNRNRQRSDSVSWAGLSRQPQAGVRREGRRTVFATSFWGTLFMPLVTGLLLVFIALLVFLAVSGFLPTVHDWAAKAAAGVFLLYGLKRSEGWWFGLTCRRFASIGGGELVLYGAFGRTRFRCPTDWRFDYLCSVRCRIFSFRTISPDGHSRRFSTSLCRNTAALIAELGAVDRGREMSVAMQNGFMELFDNLDKRKRRGWRILIGLVSATVLLACVRQIFGNTLLSPFA